MFRGFIFLPYNRTPSNSYCSVQQMSEEETENKSVRLELPLLETDKDFFDTDQNQLSSSKEDKKRNSEKEDQEVEELTKEQEIIAHKLISSAFTPLEIALSAVMQNQLQIEKNLELIK